MDTGRRSLLQWIGGATLALAALGDGRAAPAAAATQETTAHWAMVIDLRLCIGCQACTVACSLENQIPLGSFRTIVSAYETTRGGRPRRAVLPRLCNHCEHPACVTVCPTKATSKRPDGIVVVDNTVCVGCGYCIQACPYDARFINTSTRTADKCTFCLHRLEAGLLPACVETCVSGARVFGDLGDPHSQVSQLLRQYPTQVLKKHMGTGPQVFYIGLDQAFDDRLQGVSTLWPAGSDVHQEEI